MRQSSAQRSGPKPLRGRLRDLPLLIVLFLLSSLFAIGELLLILRISS